jgi:GAF domain-containing protein/CheY-like chemotaxis protein
VGKVRTKARAGTGSHAGGKTRPRGRAKRAAVAGPANRLRNRAPRRNGNAPEIVGSAAELAAARDEVQALRRQLAEASERETATGEVLRLVAGSPTELQPVLNAVAERAARLCEAKNVRIWRLDGDTLRHVADFGTLSHELRAENFDLPLDRSSLTGRAVVEAKTIHIDDFTAVARREYPATAKYAKKYPLRTGLAAPLLRDGKPVGAILVIRTEVRPFTERQIALIQTFAAQAVIAIENARLLEELREALEQQTASGEILRTIAGTPAEAERALTAICETAMRMFGASSVAIRRVEGGMLRAAASAGGAGTAVNAAMPEGPLDPKTIPVARAILQRRQVPVGDMANPAGKEERELAKTEPWRLAVAAGARSSCVTPLIRQGEAIGALLVFRNEVRPFTDKELALLKSFADQAVIAIENARLLGDLRASLEQQTATSEVLRAIASSPGEAERVLGTIARTARRLFRGARTAITRVDGEVFREVAAVGTDSTAISGLLSGRRIDATIPSGRAVLEKRTVHVEDIQSRGGDYPESRAVGERLGTRSIVAAPLIREGEAIGTITVARAEPRPFGRKEIELLESFAAQAVIAIENARLLGDLRESLEQQTATSDVLRAIASTPGEAERVLDTIARTAQRLFGARSADITRIVGGMFRGFAGAGPSTDEAAAHLREAPMEGTVAGRAVADRKTILIEDIKTRADDFPATPAVRLDLPVRTMVSTPLLREGEPIGAVTITFGEVRPLTAKQIELLESFAAQAVIAIENARLLDELNTRMRELTEALERQTATSSILRAIAGSPTDVQPVLDTIARTAHRLFDAWNVAISQAEGDRLRLFAGAGPGTGVAQDMYAARPLDRASASGRAYFDRAVVQIEDIQARADEFASSPGVAGAGDRSVAAAPLLREGEPIGAIMVSRGEVRPFAQKELDLLASFADQAVIAIENTRLFQVLQTRTGELTVSLEQQTATSEVLRAIASAPGEAERVLDTIARTVDRLFKPYGVTITRADGEVFRQVASAGEAGAPLQSWLAGRPIDRGTVAGRALLEKRTVHVEDLRRQGREYPSRPQASELQDLRTIIGTPLIREGEAIGTIAVSRREVRPFTKKEIELLESFAAQAVIAIENARLLDELNARMRELSESLEQQTATSEVLRVIASSRGEVNAVLDTIARTSQRLFGASGAGISRIDDGVFRQIAVVGDSAEGAQQTFAKHPVDRGSPAGRAAAERRTVHVEDVLEEAAEFPTAPAVLGRTRNRTILATPLMREGEAIGTMTLQRTEVRPFTPKQIALVESFADQAVIAIENARLLDELNARMRDLSESLERQTATSEVLRAIASSPQSLEPVLQTVAENAARLCAAQEAAILRADGDVLRFAAAYGGGLAERIVQDRRSVPATRTSLAGLALIEGRTIHLPDFRLVAAEYPDSDFNRPEMRDVRTVLVVPMLREGVAIGCIGVFRIAVEPFTDKQVELVESFAAQAVIAIENARLLAELRGSLDRQTAMSEVLGVISSSPGQLAPVFGAMLENALRLCESPSGVLLRVNGGVFEVVAALGVPPEFEAEWLRAPFRPPAESNMGRMLAAKDVIHDLDVAQSPGYLARHPISVSAVEVGGIRTALHVPMLKDGEVVGAFNLWRSEVRSFDDEQIELVRNFAAQAVIAIENARLLDELNARMRELSEALEQLTATSEILRTIASAPGEAEHALDVIAATAARICRAEGVNIRRLEGSVLRSIGAAGAAASAVRKSRREIPHDGTSAPSICVREGRQIYIEDNEGENPLVPSAIVEVFRRANLRSLVVTPLMRRGEAIGTLQAHRAEPRGFTAKDLKLLESFADQAVIAIENARLLDELNARMRELSESLEQQTATSEILRTIASAPGEAQRALDTIAETVVRMFGAVSVSIRRVEGDAVLGVGSAGPAAALLRAELPAIRLDNRALGSRAIMEARQLQISDIEDAARTGVETKEIVDLLRRVGVRVVVATPLMREGKGIGAIMAHRAEPRPFTEKELQLLRSFADQAVIAIENARLLEELNARMRDLSESLEQQTATSEILRAIASSQGDAESVLGTITATARRLFRSHGCTVTRIENGVFRQLAFAGPTVQAAMEGLTGTPVDRTSVAGCVALEGRAYQVEDARLVPEMSQRNSSIGTIAGAPLLREGEVIGTLTVAMTEVRPLSDKELALLQSFADQAVIAIENARLLDELNARMRDLSESLEQQTATSEILRTIASAPGAAKRALDSIAETAVRRFEASSVGIRRVEGGMLRYIASAGPAVDDIKEAFPEVPLDLDSILGRAVLERRQIHIEDNDRFDHVEKAFGQGAIVRLSRSLGTRTAAFTPLLREGEGIGVMVVNRNEPRPFAESELRQMTSFADQAVIAIENARLLQELNARMRDLSESLEQQTATSEVLRVIASAPGEPERVLRTIADTAYRLFGATGTSIARVEGQVFGKAVAVGRHADAIVDRLSGLTVDRMTVAGRAVIEKQLVHVEDLSRVVHEFPSAPAASMAGTTVSAPLLREGDAVGALTVHLRDVRPFTGKQLELLQSFADQAVIAIENARLLGELRESLEQQTATSEVLRVIASSPGEPKRALDTIAETAARLFGASSVGIRRAEDGVLRYVGTAGSGMDALHAAFKEVAVDDTTLVGRTFLEKRQVRVDDIESEEGRAQVHPSLQQVARRSIRSLAMTPLMREGEAIGVMVVNRADPRPFTDKELQLMTGFADQAVIAIENARLLDELQARMRDLSESLEQQTATADILGVIAGSPGKVEPVLQAVAENAGRLCEASQVMVHLVEGDVLPAVASYGTLLNRVAEDRVLVPITRGSVVGRAILDRRTVHIADYSLREFTDSPGRAYAETHAVRSAMATPLLREGVAIGGIFLARTEVRPFTDKQIELVESFAAQAVIAIENARLLGELRESLEQQTATSEVLRVIASSPGEPKRALDTIAETAARLFGASGVGIRRVEDGVLRYVGYAGAGLNEMMTTFKDVPLDGTLQGRAVLEKRQFHIGDIDSDEGRALLKPEMRELACLFNRSLVMTPLVREGEGIGVMTVNRGEVRPFTDKELQLMTGFADQAVIAIENARLLDELQARTRELARSVEELRALGAVGQAVSSTLDLQKVLDTIAEKAVALAGADAGAIHAYDEATGTFVLQAAHRMAPAILERLRQAPVRLGDGAAGQAALRREAVQFSDVAAAPDYPMREAVTRAGYRAVLAVPLAREDRIIGAIVLMRRSTGEFLPATVALLQTFASQSALAIQNASLYREIEAKGRELAIASQHKSQFLANMSHELRTPLNAIIGLTEMLCEEAAAPEHADFAEPLERVQRAGKHLLGLINDVLDLSKIEAGRVELREEEIDLAALARDLAVTAQPLADKNGNRLALSCPADVGAIRGDQMRLRQVLINLLGNACKFTERGEVALTVARAARNGRDGVSIAVADTGIGMTPEQVGKLFTEFAQADPSTTRKYGGTGLGLAISRRLVEMMGGSIAVESAPGKGSTFTVWLPAAPDGAPSRADAETTAGAAAAPADPARTVLVIDDDPNARDLMRRFLAREGFDTLTAADGEEGLRLARQFRPSLITLDVLMPRLDGWAVLKELQADPALAGIPVLMLTILDEQEKGFALGAADYLIKPFDRDRLRAILARHRPAAAGARVLVVEDEAGTRALLRDLLDREGCTVDEAEDGIAALARLDAGTPDLILLDLLMPRMDGFQFLEALRGLPGAAGIPIVVLTAKDLSAAERKRLAGETRRVLKKSLHSREELAAELRRALAARKGVPGHA